MHNNIPVSKHHIRESAAVVILKILFIFITGELLYTFSLFLFLSNNPFEGTEITFFIIWAMHTIFMVAESGFIMATVLSRLCTDYYLTEHAFVLHKGIIHVEEEIYELQNIRAVKRNQSWLGKIFKYGNVIFTIATANYQKDIVLRGIRKPKKYSHLVEELIAAQKSKMP